MSKKIERLGKQFGEVMDKYEEFRQCPRDKVETKREAYKHALDVLGYMFKIYNRDSDKETNPTKEEQDLLDLLEDRNVLENVIRGHYNTRHGLLDGFVDIDDLEKIEEIRKASEGELYDFKVVLKELGIDLDKE